MASGLPDDLGSLYADVILHWLRTNTLVHKVNQLFDKLFGKTIFFSTAELKVD